MIAVTVTLLVYSPTGLDNRCIIMIPKPIFLTYLGFYEVGGKHKQVKIHTV